MKKSFVWYLFGWIAILGLFNVITFVTPSEINGVSKYDTLFWVAYAAITLTFIGQLACGYFILRKESLDKEYYKRMFYNISIYRVTLIGLIAMLIVGGLCMAVIAIPDWLGIIACCIVLVANIIAIAKAQVGVSVISAIDKKIKVKTMFIKTLTVDAQVLMQNAATPELSAIAKKVYEGVRYSDPMSDDALASVEDRISEQFSIFSEAINSGDVEGANVGATKIQNLLNERNAKCKILK